MNILITGADRGLGFGLTRRLLERGHTVFAGQYLTEWRELQDLQQVYPGQLYPIPMDVSDPSSLEAARRNVAEIAGRLDVLVNNAGVNGRSPDEEPMRQNYESMLSTYNVNALGAVRVTETFWDLLRQGEEKRLVFVSSEAGSVTSSIRTDFYGYCMSKAALNMYVKILFNRWRPEGYRFRLYHPGWIKSYMGGELSERGHLTIDEAADCALRQCFEQGFDEDELVIRTYDGSIYPF